MWGNVGKDGHIKQNVQNLGVYKYCGHENMHTLPHTHVLSENVLKLLGFYRFFMFFCEIFVNVLKNMLFMQF